MEHIGTDYAVILSNLIFFYTSSSLFFVKIVIGLFQKIVIGEKSSSLSKRNIGYLYFYYYLEKHLSVTDKIIWTFTKPC
jgi:hypothetical protein